jgi:acetyl-CoA acetyltransferase
VEVKQGHKTQLVSEDNHRRPDTTRETLEKLPLAFRTDSGQGMAMIVEATG